jgi:hypothetical protein
MMPKDEEQKHSIKSCDFYLLLYRNHRKFIVGIKQGFHNYICTSLLNFRIMSKENVMKIEKELSSQM